ncbi:19779_t:CDS:2 [Gigaspora rosea]|nr:19779_t:CDS:2 [Gigaspora rosea]
MNARVLLKFCLCGYEEMGDRFVLHGLSNEDEIKYYCPISEAIILFHINKWFGEDDFYYIMIPLMMMILRRSNLKTLEFKGIGQYQVHFNESVDENEEFILTLMIIHASMGVYIRYPQISFGVFVVAKTGGYTEPARSRARGSPYKILLTDYENICEDVMKFIQNLESSKDLNKVIKSVKDLNELLIKNSITLAEIKKITAKQVKE